MQQGQNKRLHKKSSKINSVVNKSYKKNQTTKTLPRYIRKFKMIRNLGYIIVISGIKKMTMNCLWSVKNTSKEENLKSTCQAMYI